MQLLGSISRLELTLNRKSDFTKAVRSPFLSVLQIFFAASKGYWWKRYARISRHKGLNSLSLIVSFDCDTDQDAQAAGNLHPQMMRIGIKPVYAVPGEILADNKDIFVNILDQGGKFINHGYRRHTYYDKKQKILRSCFFYDQLPLTKVLEDIASGHKALKEWMGIRVSGFRTPHFGTFQQKRHLNFLYHELNQLGYAFSTSTVPLRGFLRGPFYQPGGFEGLMEFPVTGHLGRPLSVLDSWRYWDGAKHEMNYVGYGEELLNLVRFFTRKKWPGLLNLYVDPLHVAHMRPFVKIMEECIQLGAEPTDYEGLRVALAG